MSKHRLWIGATALSLVAAGCGGSGNPDRATPGAAGTSGTPSMTLRGCIVAGSPAGTYMLNTTEWGEQGEVAGTSGVNAPSHDPKVQPEYRLIATGNLDLGRHLGNEVQLTGEMADSAQDGRNETGTSGTTPDRAERPGTAGEGDIGKKLGSQANRGSGNGRVQGQGVRAGAQFFRVTEVTKVSDSCSSGDSSHRPGDDAKGGDKGESKKK